MQLSSAWRLPPGAGLFGLLFLLYPVIYIPLVAVGVRRLHDTGMSGWAHLVSLIPLVGLWVLVMLASEGEKEANKYGESPKPAPANPIASSATSPELP